MLRTFSLYILIFCIGAAVPTVSDYIKYEMTGLGSFENYKIETVELNKVNHVLLEQGFTMKTVGMWQEKFLELIKLRGDKNYTIYIVLNSDGGDLSAGDMFIELVKQYKNIKTISIKAISIAHAVVQRLPGERLAVRNNFMLAHLVSRKIIKPANVLELEATLEDLKAVDSLFNQANADRIGVSISYYVKKAEKEWVTRGFYSVLHNFVDRIVDIKCSEELLSDVQIVDVDMYTKVKVSSCPIVIPTIVNQNDLKETQNEPSI